MDFGDSKEAEIELNSLITEYKASDITIFKDFAEYLNKYRTEIINSFTIREVSRRTTQEQETYYSVYLTDLWKGLIESQKIIRETLEASLISIIHVIVSFGLLEKIHPF